MRWPLQFCFLSELSRTLKEADNHGGGGQLPQGMSVLMAPGLSPWLQLALQADCSSPGAIPRISGATVHFLSRTACFALAVLYCPQKGFPSVWPSFEISVMEPKAFMYTGVGGGERGAQRWSSSRCPWKSDPRLLVTLYQHHPAQYSDTHPIGLAGGNFYF